MIFLGNLLIAVKVIFDIIAFWLMILIFARAIVSWANADPFNPFVRFLHKATEPILAPVRRLLPLGPVDFSPIIAWLLIIVLQIVVFNSLGEYGQRIKLRNSFRTEIYQIENIGDRAGQEETPIVISE